VVKLPEATRFCAAAAPVDSRENLRVGDALRRLVRAYERLPQTLADLYVIVLACIMLRQAVNYIAVHNSLCPLSLRRDQH
jgi:hypothetical protein